MEEIEWLYDYLLQFLQSPAWQIPIISFIDQHCSKFESTDQNKLEYTPLFNQFKQIIDILLENLCEQLGINQQIFINVYELGLKNPRHQHIFEKVLACDDFIHFKTMMVKRNKQLQVQALSLMREQGQATNQEVEQASKEKQEADLALAIKLSLAAQQLEKKKSIIQSQELQKALKASQQEFKREKQIVETTTKAEDQRSEESQKQEKLKKEIKKIENKARNAEQFLKTSSDAQAILKEIQRQEKEDILALEKARRKEQKKKQKIQKKLKQEKLARRKARKQAKEKAQRQAEEQRKAKQIRREQRRQKRKLKEQQRKILQQKKEEDQARQQTSLREEQETKINKVQNQIEQEKIQQNQTQNLLDFSESVQKTQKPLVKSPLGQLPPVQFGKEKLADIFKIEQQFLEKQEAESGLKVDETPLVNSERESDIKRSETIEERKVRLQMQRDLLKAKKQEDREAEMKIYRENGGMDLMKKQPMAPLPSLVNNQDLEKKRIIIEKFKEAEILQQIKGSFIM